MSTAHSDVDSSTKKGDHVDAKGIPIAPKSMIDLESWKDGDAEIWDKAIDKRRRFGVITISPLIRSAYD